MQDITAALTDQGVDVREEYWTGDDENRQVFVEMTPVALPIKEIKVQPDGSIHVVVDG